MNHLFSKRSIIQAGIVFALTAVMMAFPGLIPHEALAATPLLFAGNVLDVFKSDAFSVVSMTDVINNVPFVPGRAGSAVSWNEQGVNTTSIMLEQKGGVLALVNPSPRGSPGDTFAKDKATARVLSIPHYQIDDAIMADEVQNVRAFGTENQLQSLQSVVQQRLANLVQLKMDPTLEYQRIGALKGIILNADGTTLYNLFTEFGVTQTAEFNFELDVDGSATQAIRQVCTNVRRALASALGGIPFTGIRAFCSDNFFDALIVNPEVARTYLNQAEAAQLRSGINVYGEFNYGGITFENYRGEVDGTSFIPTSKCHIFPEGVPGLFRTVYAPADYVETVNTIGLPRYAKQYVMQNGKGISLDLQMNPLSYCTRPAVLMKGKLT